MSETTKVLVVDDDPAIRLMVERVLKREKFVVDCARDGHEAIEKLSKNDYGTVILDLMMPRVDGHGVIRFLIDERDEPKPRVIIMTAGTWSASQHERPAPVFRVLPKPFEIHELVRHVRDCTEQDSRSSGDREQTPAV